jgi:hypothetical protein
MDDPEDNENAISNPNKDMQDEEQLRENLDGRIHL